MKNVLSVFEPDPDRAVRFEVEIWTVPLGGKNPAWCISGEQSHRSVKSAQRSAHKWTKSGIRSRVIAVDR